MKKVILIVLVALFVLTPISVYAYSNKEDISFDWMTNIFMHENHHEQMDEWINEAIEEGQLSEEEVDWLRNHHNQESDYRKSTGFGCHN